MSNILGVALGLLGLALGFIIASVIGAGEEINLVYVLLLAIFGAIVGFVVEWIIDESIRKNRELRHQLNEPRGAPMLFEGQVVDNQGHDSETLSEVLRQLTALKESRLAMAANVPTSQDSSALTDALRQHSEELHQLREQITAKDDEVGDLRRKFEAYQKSHPDELTHIRGIGPVYQRKLRDIGFSSYEQLAKADPAQIRRMLGIKDWQRVDIASWVQQARDWAEHS